jgi:nucleoside-diphosphate-sugar epimerase
MSQRILIAGAGDLGVRTGLHLARAGHTVFALRRNPAGLPPELQPVAADLSRQETLSAVPGAIERVVYCAAADASTDEAYNKAYVLGLSNLLHAVSVQRLPPERIVFVSSTAVYGQSDGSWVREDSVTEPESFSGIRTLQAEALLEHSGLRGVVVRSGGIYGPGRTQLLDQVRAETASYNPDLQEYGNRIHVEDLALAIVHLLERPQSEPYSVYNAVDHAQAPRREVLQWLAEALGKAAPKASAVPEAKARRARPGDKRVDGAKLRASGYQFSFPSYREGYGAMLAELATNAPR